MAILFTLSPSARAASRISAAPGIAVQACPRSGFIIGEAGRVVDLVCHSAGLRITAFIPAPPVIGFDGETVCAPARQPPAVPRGSISWWRSPG